MSTSLPLFNGVIHHLGTAKGLLSTIRDRQKSEPLPVPLSEEAIKALPVVEGLLKSLQDVLAAEEADRQMPTRSNPNAMSHADTVIAK